MPTQRDDLDNLAYAIGTGNNTQEASGGFQISLDDIASGFLGDIAKSAASGIGNLIDNKTRSSNTQPVPDLSAAAAKPAVSSFLEGSAFGVSLPILVLGVGALGFVLWYRR